jgi:hypothetical protein
MNKEDKAKEMELWLKEASNWLFDNIEIRTAIWHSADNKDYYVKCDLESLELTAIQSFSIEAKETITKDECVRQLFASAKVLLSKALDERLSEFVKEEHAVYKPVVKVKMIDGIKGFTIHTGKFNPDKEELTHYKRTLESNCLKNYVLKQYCSIEEQRKSLRNLDWLHEFRRRMELVRNSLKYETIKIEEKTYEW